MRTAAMMNLTILLWIIKVYNVASSCSSTVTYNLFPSSGGNKISGLSQQYLKFTSAVAGDIYATAYDYHTPIPNTFNRMVSKVSDTCERGLGIYGLNNTGSRIPTIKDSEIDIMNHYIQFNVSGINQLLYNRIQFTIGSTTVGEGFQIYGSNNPGVLGTILYRSPFLNSANATLQCPQIFSYTSYTKYKYYGVTALDNSADNPTPLIPPFITTPMPMANILVSSLTLYCLPILTSIAPTKSHINNTSTVNPSFLPTSSLLAKPTINPTSQPTANQVISSAPSTIPSKFASVKPLTITSIRPTVMLPATPVTTNPTLYPSPSSFKPIANYQTNKPTFISSTMSTIIPSTVSPPETPTSVTSTNFTSETPSAIPTAVKPSVTPSIYSSTGTFTILPTVVGSSSSTMPFQTHIPSPSLSPSLTLSFTLTPTQINPLFQPTIFPSFTSTPTYSNTTIGIAAVTTITQSAATLSPYMALLFLLCCLCLLCCIFCRRKTAKQYSKAPISECEQNLEFGMGNLYRLSPYELENAAYHSSPLRDENEPCNALTNVDDSCPNTSRKTPSLSSMDEDDDSSGIEPVLTNNDNDNNDFPYSQHNPVLKSIIISGADSSPGHDQSMYQASPCNSDAADDIVFTQNFELETNNQHKDSVPSSLEIMSIEEGNHEPYLYNPTNIIIEVVSSCSTDENQKPAVEIDEPISWFPSFLRKNSTITAADYSTKVLPLDQPGGISPINENSESHSITNPFLRYPLRAVSSRHMNSTTRNHTQAVSCQPPKLQSFRDRLQPVSSRPINQKAPDYPWAVSSRRTQFIPKKEVWAPPALQDSTTTSPITPWIPPARQDSKIRYFGTQRINQVRRKTRVRLMIDHSDELSGDDDETLPSECSDISSLLTCGITAAAVNTSEAASDEASIITSNQAKENCSIIKLQTNKQKCAVCNQSVYPAEKVVAINRVWHKSCFCCGGTSSKSACKRMLTLQTYLNHGDDPFYEICHGLVTS